MKVPPKSLADDGARRTAIAIHARSLLVEAGAGSGKTAVMAGRIALMLANGMAPQRIAAVTFTELAASELLIRVREVVGALSQGRVPTELRIALPEGLTAEQAEHVAAASATIDEITCTTIHGFCQRLIKPYPVEADIDPGASVMDRGQADLAYLELTETWIRDELAGMADGLLAEMVLQDPGTTVKLVHEILSHLRSRRELQVDAPDELTPLVDAFRAAAAALASFVTKAQAKEPETAEIAAWISDLATQVGATFPTETPGNLVRFLQLRPSPEMCTQTGSFRAYRMKGKWVEAAKRVGLSKTDAERLNTSAEQCYAACRDAWTALTEAVAARVLANLVRLVQPVMDRFRDYKRSAALLDFDDLIHAACDLLRRHEAVRRALAARFAHVLVDEFQDTDSMQTEIFWRLCGDPLAGADPSDWTRFRIRPGALFLVGDPKQAIYRFRGADVAAYIQARDLLVSQDAEAVLSISTNFRSLEPILSYVNERFAGPLALENGQPGFTALDPFHPGLDDGVSVAALNIGVADAEGKASAERQRDGEAEAVADLCARLIGSRTIHDHKGGVPRPCRPGDIALLAPTGSDLWRYEEALERRGIPVATQAGKGLFRRQEIQDLIALTRVVADRRDTLALGALLRGPLVGLSEEELLDIVWALPRPEDAPDALPRLHLGVAPETIVHPYAREVFETLQVLGRQVNSTTPYDLLSQAVDALRVRPILLQRHRDQAERALANVDLYLSLSRAYAVRGFRAFAEVMAAAWTDESRAVEGRPDAQEEAVALYTMHAAKGLEWPVVVPINTMTQIKATEGAVTARETGRFYCQVFGVKPTGYDDARDVEKSELDRERVRLWYVAATRARELLVLPRLDVEAKRSTWISLLDLSLENLPALDVSHLPAEVVAGEGGAENPQTQERFAAEAAAIDERRRHIRWLVPSRDEGISGPVTSAEEPAIMLADAKVEAVESAFQMVQGGRERGVVMHKLFEEVLTGETAETEAALVERAETLIRAIGKELADDPARGLVPAEVAGCVLRSLSLPEIAALKPSLLSEFSVYASTQTADGEEVCGGVADAIAFGPDGRPEVVIDWKSDVAPAPETLAHYRSQVRAYMDMVEADKGLIVLATLGIVVPVTKNGG